MEQVKEQPKQWTREHDAVIAEKVEGLKITTEHFNSAIGAWNRYFYNDPDWGMVEIPSYNQPKHIFRALEKWREAKVGRYWIIESSNQTEVVKDPFPMYCSLTDSQRPIFIRESGPNAPAWALYKAVADEV